MGVLIQSINALDVANLSEQEIIRKILQMLPKPRYNIVKALLFEKDFTTLTITEVVNKIRSHEMFMMEDMESSTSHSSVKKDLALKASKKIKSKKPMQSLLLPQVRAKIRVIQVKWRAMMQCLLSS
jgi:hypothetical protein